MGSRRGQRMLNEVQAQAFVRSEPRRLLQVLKNRTGTPYELYLAAEYLGQTSEPDRIQVLCDLLLHPNALVREGAARGLANTEDPKARVALSEIAERDKSEAVRLA